MKTFRVLLFNEEVFRNPAHYRACRIEAALYCLAAMATTVAVIITCSLFHWQQWTWVFCPVYIFGVMLWVLETINHEVKYRLRWDKEYGMRWDAALGPELGRIAWNIITIMMSTAFCAMFFCVVSLVVALAAIAVFLCLAACPVVLLFHTIRWVTRKIFCQPGAVNAAVC